MPMILSVLEAHVDPASEGKLHAAYGEAAGDALPSGLLRSTLSHATHDRTLWRIETLWESREALEAMRGSGTPRGIMIFRAAGAEPTLSLFVVTMVLSPPMAPPNQRLQRAAGGDRAGRNGSVLIASPAGRSLCSIR